jgi:hypothetical protein
MAAPGRGEEPARAAPPVEEQQPDADDEGQQGQPEGLGPEPAPEAGADRDLVREQVGSAHGHQQAQEELPDAALRAAGALHVSLDVRADYTCLWRASCLNPQRKPPLERGFAKEDDRP